ncbi:MAG: type II toxin-antitoxin system HicA family toxin [Holophagaceae bacterium]|nr:type II toxin-antitoxin system HicA family toxin [Holophagaceae bacterium]
MNFKELERIIKADGWSLDRVEGSHHQYRHPTKPGIATIPRHSHDIHKKIVKSVLRQACIKVKP